VEGGLITTESEWGRTPLVIRTLGEDKALVDSYLKMYA
jgi:hypothetical protein